MEEAEQGFGRSRDLQRRKVVDPRGSGGLPGREPMDFDVVASARSRPEFPKTELWLRAVSLVRSTGSLAEMPHSAAHVEKEGFVMFCRGPTLGLGMAGKVSRPLGWQFSSCCCLPLVRMLNPAGIWNRFGPGREAME